MKKISVNKNAGFLIRLLSLFIDVIIFCAIGISASLMCISKNPTKFSLLFGDDKKNELSPSYQFSLHLVKEDYNYYLWLILLLCVLTIEFILIPLLAKGRTLGMMICRLDLKHENQSLEKGLLKRIELGVLLWMLIIIIFMAMVNTKLINKLSIRSYLRYNADSINDFLKNNFDDPKKIEYYQIRYFDTGAISEPPNSAETFLYAFPSAISPIVVLVQLFLLISVGFKKEKIGLVDRFSETRIVYHNKFDYIEVKQMILISPEKYVKNEIIWK